MAFIAVLTFEFGCLEAFLLSSFLWVKIGLGCEVFPLEGVKALGTQCPRPMPENLNTTSNFKLNFRV